MSDDFRAAGTPLIAAVHGEIERIARRLGPLVRRIEGVEEAADRLHTELSELAERLAEAPVNGLVTIVSANDRRQVDGALRRTAVVGASSLSVTRQHNGKHAIRVDGGKEFELPPLLGDLLGILAADTGRSHDVFVPYKSYDHVVKKLAAINGETMRRHALNHALYRLRRELYERGDVNPYYVQVDRRRGVRFALRRDTASAGPSAAGGGSASPAVACETSGAHSRFGLPTAITAAWGPPRT